jgi:hypothetical protein
MMPARNAENVSIVITLKTVSTAEPVSSLLKKTRPIRPIVTTAPSEMITQTMVIRRAALISSSFLIPMNRKWDVSPFE